ncbi:MAG: hypothetical protein NZ518_00025 [Dehalococcoidia bacterium]|nr:hypothetical protein [Dehalococcoidia bacterium]
MAKHVMEYQPTPEDDARALLCAHEIRRDRKRHRAAIEWLRNKLADMRKTIDQETDHGDRPE